MFCGLFGLLDELCLVGVIVTLSVTSCCWLFDGLLTLLWLRVFSCVCVCVCRLVADFGHGLGWKDGSCFSVIAYCLFVLMYS